MTFLKNANLGLSFFLELGMLAAYAYWGFNAGDSLLVQILLGFGLVIVTVIIWGIFLAPQSPRRLREPLHLVIELILFAAAILALYDLGETIFAAGFAILLAINKGLAFAWGQEGTN